ncbi:MAG: signal peptidase I [Mogibacterium sp.]|nr:signal peptidase I [Mogibacterium sp.]
MSKKKKGRRYKRTPLAAVLNGVGTLIMILSIVICLALALPRLAGYQTYVVVSGSMEPAIPVGSMLYVKACDPATLTEGDVVMFYGNLQQGVPITHRVVENHPEDGELVTKGDANDKNDLAPARYENVIGKVRLYVPELGYIASPLAMTTGKIAMAAIILAGYLLTEIASRVNRRRA